MRNAADLKQNAKSKESNRKESPPSKLKLSASKRNRRENAEKQRKKRSAREKKSRMSTTK